MKKFASLLVACIITCFAFKQSEHDLTGKWYSQLPDNSRAYFDFNKDGSFKVTVNRQTENEGNYKLNSDTFYMFDKIAVSAYPENICFIFTALILFRFQLSMILVLIVQTK